MAVVSPDRERRHGRHRLTHHHRALLGRPGRKRTRRPDDRALSQRDEAAGHHLHGHGELGHLGQPHRNPHDPRRGRNPITFKGEKADDSDGINIDWISLPNSADTVSGNYVINPESGSNATSFGATSAKTNNIAGWYQTSTGNTDNDASCIEYGSDYSDRWNAVHPKPTAYTVSTGQDITVPNGTYSLSAYVRSSGGQTAQYMKATTSSGTQQVTIGAYSTYTKVTVPGIQVTDGHITIGFHSNALAGQWLAFDNVQLLATQ